MVRMRIRGNRRQWWPLAHNYRPAIASTTRVIDGREASLLVFTWAVSRISRVHWSGHVIWLSDVAGHSSNFA